MGYFLPECNSGAHHYSGDTCNATMPIASNATCGRPPVHECGYDGCDFNYQNKQLTDILTIGGAALGWCICKYPNLNKLYRYFHLVAEICVTDLKNNSFWLNSIIDLSKSQNLSILKNALSIVIRIHTTY